MNDLLNTQINEKFFFHISEIYTKVDKKTFCFIDNNDTYRFISDFVLVTQNFIKYLSKNIFILENI